MFNLYHITQHKKILSFVIGVFALLLAFLGFTNVYKVYADIPGPVLYACPASIYIGWDGRTVNYVGQSAATLPNGHPFCAYSVLQGDFYTGAFDRVLGAPINYYRLVAPSSYNGYDLISFGSFAGLTEAVGSTGSKCADPAWGDSMYYIVRNCGQTFSGTASPAALTAIGVNINGAPRLNGQVLFPNQNCIYYGPGTCSATWLPPTPPPDDPGANGGG